MKVKHITESISSKQIEQDVLDSFQKKIKTRGDIKNFTTIVKRSIKDTLEKYDIDLPVEVSVQTKPKTHYGEISVSVNNKNYEALRITASFILNKDEIENNFDNYILRLRQLIVHELVHVIQTMRAKYKDSISKVKRNYVHDDKSWKEYLKNKKEIEAYAVNAAQELRDRNVDPDKLEKYLKSDELIRKLGKSKMSESFTYYFEEFYNSEDVRDQQVWKRFMKRFLHHVNELMRNKENINENESNDKMPEYVREKFAKLGEQQRGQPESVMVKLQHFMGGGILNLVIEHTGDLIHRMTHQMKWGSKKDGYETVKEKLDKVLERLEDNFEEKIETNLQNNAEFFEKDPEEFREEINKGLKVYAMEHEKLTPYNEVQWLAQKASVALGMRKWRRARYYLNELQSYAQSKEQWNKKATEYELDDSGELKEYTP